MKLLKLPSGRFLNMDLLIDASIWQARLADEADELEGGPATGTPIPMRVFLGFAVPMTSVVEDGFQGTDLYQREFHGENAEAIAAWLGRNAEVING